MSKTYLPYPGDADGYAQDALPFHRACFLRDDAVTIDELEQRYRALLDKSRGTRFETWTHEDMAIECHSRALTAVSQVYAQRAVDTANLEADPAAAPRARAILAAAV